MSTRTPAVTARIPTPAYVTLVLAVVFVWGTGDLLSTLLALHFTGLYAEANPLVRALLARGPLLAIAFKGAIALLVGLLLLEYQSEIECVPRWRVWLTGLVGVGSGVVLVNLYVAYTAAPV
jgi:hypothetical protein